ncbi:MAG: GNAT family N-acetyltransferase [Bacteroidaceae bacterium]|nr:GNAT family N-acetyltransferase [Bacteroidaceae bacterium]
MVTPYIYSMAQEWDDAVRRADGGVFQFESRYMDYHRARFRDASLLVRDARGKAVAAFPAVYADERAVVSHAGLTFGGLLHDPRAHAADVLAMLDDVCAFYQTKGCKRLIYKAVPYIYKECGSETDLYWLHRNGARISARALSSAVNLQAPLPLSLLRRRGVAKARRAGVLVSQSADYVGYWNVLVEVLRQRHGVRPVHTLDEIRLLADRFHGRIRLHTAVGMGKLLAGAVVYADRGVAHAQYIASGDDGRTCGALDLLFARLLDDYRAEGFRWFDFGISTDHSGASLNPGLLRQKEGFGARTVVYDTYEVDLN